MKAKKATATYREVLKLQEKLKDAEVISYQDLVRCPRNKLPAHVDKLQLQVSYRPSICRLDMTVRSRSLQTETGVPLKCRIF